MRQLRTHFKEVEVFVKQLEPQMAAGYRLAASLNEGKVVAVAGYRFLEFLSWGKILYVDDLVTDERLRGKGHGGALLDWVAKKARGEGCNQVHLDSATHRHEAHKVYMNHGFVINSYHFAIENLTD